MAWPYLKPADVPLYIDGRVLVKLATDLNEGEQLPPLGTVTSGGPEYLRIVEGLKVGAAEMDRRIRSGSRYDPEVLKALAEPLAYDSSLTQPKQDYGAILRRLNAAGLVAFLQDRRVRAIPESEDLKLGILKWAEEVLQGLENGGELIPGPTSTPVGVVVDTTKIAANEAASLPDLQIGRTCYGDPWLPVRGWPHATDADRVTFSDRLWRGFRSGGW